MSGNDSYEIEGKVEDFLRGYRLLEHFSSDVPYFARIVEILDEPSKQFEEIGGYAPPELKVPLLPYMKELRKLFTGFNNLDWVKKVTTILSLPRTDWRFDMVSNFDEKQWELFSKTHGQRCYNPCVLTMTYCSPDATAPLSFIDSIWFHPVASVRRAARRMLLDYPHFRGIKFDVILFRAFENYKRYLREEDCDVSIIAIGIHHCVINGHADMDNETALMNAVILARLIRSHKGFKKIWSSDVKKTIVSLTELKKLSSKL